MSEVQQAREPGSAEEAKLYERVAGKLRESIEAGALRPGDRIPSVRQLSRQENVSISTVLQALARLESGGWIEARPQSGHYVKRRRAVPEPPRPSQTASTSSPVTVSALVKQVYAATRDDRMVALGTAIPSPDLLPVKRVNRVLAQLTRDQGEVVVGYDLPPGNLLLRQQVARRAINAGMVLSPEDLITTCGASEAITLSLMAVARRGDTVAIESPAYYGSLRVIEALGLRALELATHPQYGIELSELDASLRKRKLAAVMLVPNFSNPLGACMPEEHKKELAQLLAKYDVPLIEDDIYGDLYFGAERPKTVKAFDKRGLVLHCSSYSKTIAPGFRVGWVAPGRYRERLELLKFAQSVATPTLPQLAIAEVLGSGGYDRHLRALRRLFASQVEQVTHAVVEHFPAGTRVSRPQGGFVLWVELPKGVDSLQLHAKALELGVSIAPGPIFSSRDRFRNCLRLSCGYPWSSTIEAALRTLGNLARQLA